ncbi:MAG: hypothetical protein ABTQ29_08385 [Siculibacillus sp.]
MSELRIPVNFTMPSGDVHQTFNPMSFSFGQVGLFNVYLGEAGAPELETDILARAGSYGRQIGRIVDALEVVLDLLEREGKLENLSKAEADAVEAVRAVQVMVREVKKDHGRP